MKVSEKFAPGLISNLPTVTIISLSGAFICTSTVLRALKYFTSFDTVGPLTVFSLLTLVAAAWIFSWQRGLAQAGRDESVYLFSLMLLWVIISLATIYIYPLFNSCQQYSGGSDRDEALDAATRSLLNFSYPYLAQVKSLACNINVGPGGNPISPRLITSSKLCQAQGLANQTEQQQRGRQMDRKVDGMEAGCARA